MTKTKYVLPCRLDLTQLFSEEDKTDEGFVSKTLAFTIMGKRFPNLSEGMVHKWVGMFDTKQDDTVRYYQLIQCCGYLMAK